MVYWRNHENTTYPPPCTYSSVTGPWRNGAKHLILFLEGGGGASCFGGYFYSIPRHVYGEVTAPFPFRTLNMDDAQGLIEFSDFSHYGRIFKCSRF